MIPSAWVSGRWNRLLNASATPTLNEDAVATASFNDGNGYQEPVYVDDIFTTNPVLEELSDPFNDNSLIAKYTFNVDGSDTLNNYPATIVGGEIQDGGVSGKYINSNNRMVSTIIMY